MNTPSVLAFERKLDPSDALFSAGIWGDWNSIWEPVPVREKSVRGTISNRLKAKEQDPAKLNAKVSDPNLQTIDVASLPPKRDTLQVRFTLRVLGEVGKPSACNEPEYQKKLLRLVEGYRKETSFAELARRYAYNLANGRFLWRNRLVSENIVIEVTHIENGDKKSEWRFNAFSYPLDTEFKVPKADEKAFKEMAGVIEQGLADANGGYKLLEVTAYARMGKGQEVFPSQELIIDKGSKDKSKTLYTIDGIAGMHSQKIGNALRTIDTWHPEATMPIAVEPYGSVTTLGKAFRQPKTKNDFYTLLDEWMLKDSIPDFGNQNFVMAIFIRGGVFGSSGKEEKE